NNSAPGKSGINYPMLKNLGEQALLRITQLFNIIMLTGEIPKKWQENIIYPIPKKIDWQHQLNFTRPITLLETIKKVFTKIINNRLAQIFTKHKILSDRNWAGLPEGGTQEPISIINNVLEEAREGKKECWLLSQDISKAYDSMQHDLLEKAL